jgi:hypoxanthine phosphoribosyltransferase
MFKSMVEMKRGEEIRLPSGSGSVLFTAAEIRDRTRELGREMAKDFTDKVPILVAILRGGFIFQCDLARASEIPLEVDFLSVSRFNPEEKGATAVKVLHDLRSDVRNRNVIVIEGIRTASTKMEYVNRFLEMHEPKSIDYAALVCQAGGRNHSIPLKYKGFDIEDEFVIGCGLDYEERYRNLPIIAAFSPAK